MVDFCSWQEFVAAPRAANSLRLLSFNIQVGIQTDAYHHYLMRSWQHLLPSTQRQHTLNHIAHLVQHFDLVALQEADAGSFRSRGQNQVQHLAEQARFPFWYQQVNRNLGIARHSNGMLTRLPAVEVEQFSLPGLLPGRGLMLLTFGQGEDALTVAITHLALNKKAQFAQLDFLQERVFERKNLILMGDFNQNAEVLLQHSPLQHLNLQPLPSQATYPSWKPARALDHILISDSIRLSRMAVLNSSPSDHLPIAAEIIVPSQAQSQSSPIIFP
ncbi:MAG: hypothetical protein RL217_1700 [Pseudomonadota bacterium]|jgi:endonuclease/exonuclease/phosphatase family metal-dependent hydrolase